MKKSKKEKIWEREQGWNARNGTFHERLFAFNTDGSESPIGALTARLSALPLLLVANLLRLFINLRIGLFYHRAIGRFVGNSEYYLRREKYRELKGQTKTREFSIFISGNPVNSQILRMVSRRITVIKSELLWRYFDILRRQMPASPMWIELGKTGFYEWDEWIVPGPQLSFTDEEHERGQRVLRDLGIPDGAQYVCMFAKDRRYVDSPDTDRSKDEFWFNCDFRDCDIMNYFPAAEYLTEKSIWVVRMGHVLPEHRLETTNVRIVDYASTDRPTMEDPDFADVYLSAHCRFFLGCTSATYHLASIFDVPVAYTNMVPFSECGRKPLDIFILKKCLYTTSNEFIPYPELIRRGLDSDWLSRQELEELTAEGIVFLENSPDEILALAKEMHMRLEGVWVPREEDKALQEKFRGMYPPNGHEMSDFPGLVGAEFLRQNRNLLEH